MKRPSYGKEGRLIKIIANVCEASVPEGMIYQYDGQLLFSGSRMSGLRAFAAVQIYVGDDGASVAYGKFDG